MHKLTTDDGTSISWGEQGSKPAEGSPSVLLVHGITEQHECWRPVLDRLAESHHVVWLDLRGHGASGNAERYDLEVMASDVVAVADAADLQRPHLVGHSLGGVVVSAVGAALPVSSVTNVDQSLQLGAFKEQIVGIESLLKDPESFPAVMGGLFGQLSGDSLSDAEQGRLSELRRPDQNVVLGVWDLMFTSSAEEIATTIDAAMSGYTNSVTPYLALFGEEPAEHYADWLGSRIPGSVVETWAGSGHYPHLIDPDRFVARLESFWADN